MTIRTEEVFTPNGFPVFTYVTRGNNSLEERVALGLKMFGLVSIAGPSKSGKTVLIEKVVGVDKLITVAGGTIDSSESLWKQIISSLGVPSSTTTSTNSTVGGNVTASAKGSAGFLGTGIEGNSGLQFSGTHGSSEARVFVRTAQAQACSALRERDLTLLVDDFHYVPREVQTELSKQFKEITRIASNAQRVRIVVASVPHRADDPVRANPDLRGRICNVDLEYWDLEDLQKIAQTGLRALNVEIPKLLIQKLAHQAAGSPQLMQTMCFAIVFDALKISEKQSELRTITPSDHQIEHSLEIAASMNDSRSLVGKLEDGKKTRGSERISLAFKGGDSGDIYDCILRAIASDPPTLDFHENEIQTRVKDVCITPPSLQNIRNTLVRMQEIADSHLPQYSTFVWDGDQLSITDPHVLFYLRWCGHYRKAEMRLLVSPPIRRRSQ